jgi:hypothetical protein
MTTNLWAAWLQGRNNAPRSVQLILDTWERLNPDCQLTVLEQSHVDGILDLLDISRKHLTPQVQTNIARTYLLNEHGGAWVDATLMPTKPLMQWLLPELRREGVFAFRSSGSSALVLQNWFLWANAGNPLISAWLDFYSDYFRTRRYPPGSRRILLSRHAHDFLTWKKHIAARDMLFFVEPDRGRSCRMYPYAIHNYHLAYLIKTRPELAALWDAVPTRYHAMPTVIGQYATDPETPDETFIELALELLPIAPVHKLNHRDTRFAPMIEQALTRGIIAPSHSSSTNTAS